MLGSNWGSRPFKWFNYLADEREYVLGVEKVCSDKKGDGIISILNSCKNFAKEWVSKNAGETKTRIREVEEHCVELEQILATGNADLSITSNLKEARGELWALIRREEREWIQKSCLKWAVEGDRNTKFFHLAASARRRSNFIGSVQVGNKLHNDPSAITEAIGEYFRNLYNDSRVIPLKSFDCEMSHISGVEAERLEREFSEQEIWMALSTLDSNKNFFLASVSSLWNQYWVKIWLSLLVYSGVIQMLGSLMVSEPKRGVVCVS
ncbi:hypothetical protein V6N13_036536 [Hibiscus sabdariffa]